MKVTKAELGPILNGGRRNALLPLRGDQPTPSGRDRLHRRNGPLAGYVKITEAEIVAIEDFVDDAYARQAGHPTIDAYRDEWCRTHKAAWTGESAWLVTFTLEPHREAHTPMRGPWDPGTEDRRRAPEPEKVNEPAVDGFAEENWTRFKAANGDLHAKRELNRLGRSVREEGIRAIRRGVDVSAQLTNIQRELDAIRERAA